MFHFCCRQHLIILMYLLKLTFIQLCQMYPEVWAVTCANHINLVNANWCGKLCFTFEKTITLLFWYSICSSKTFYSAIADVSCGTSSNSGSSMSSPAPSPRNPSPDQGAYQYGEVDSPSKLDIKGRLDLLIYQNSCTCNCLRVALLLLGQTGSFFTRCNS